MTYGARDCAAAADEGALAAQRATPGLVKAQVAPSRCPRQHSTGDVTCSGRHHERHGMDAVAVRR